MSCRSGQVCTSGPRDAAVTREKRRVPEANFSRENLCVIYISSFLNVGVDSLLKASFLGAVISAI